MPTNAKPWSVGPVLHGYTQEALSHMHWVTLFALATAFSLCLPFALFFDGKTNWDFIYKFFTFVSSTGVWGSFVVPALAWMFTLGIFAFVQFIFYRASGSVETHKVHLTDAKTLGSTKHHFEAMPIMSAFSSFVSHVSTWVLIVTLGLSIMGIVSYQWDGITSAPDPLTGLIRFIVALAIAFLCAGAFFCLGHLALVFTPDIWVAGVRDFQRAQREKLAIQDEWDAIVAASVAASTGTTGNPKP